MTTNKYGDLVLTREEYELLKDVLAKQEINLSYSAWDTKTDTFECYIRNPWKTAGQGWGSEIVKKQAAEFFERGY